jgi:hypothetical protein
MSLASRMQCNEPGERIEGFFEGIPRRHGFSNFQRPLKLALCDSVPAQPPVH